MWCVCVESDVSTVFFCSFIPAEFIRSVQIERKDKNYSLSRDTCIHTTSYTLRRPHTHTETSTHTHTHTHTTPPPHTPTNPATLEHTHTHTHTPTHMHH